MITTGTIAPEDAGLKRGMLAELKGGTPAENAARLIALFDGEQGAYRDVVLLNAGAALMVAGVAKDIKDGVVKAARSLDSGAAKAKLEALITASNNPK